jgi:hypothetical protein
LFEIAGLQVARYVIEFGSVNGCLELGSSRKLVARAKVKARLATS